MSKVKFTSNAANNKANQPATVLIEIPPELFERCTRFNALPETVIQDFIENICWSEPQDNKDCRINGNDGWQLAFDYMRKAYGNLQIVDLRSASRLRKAVMAGRNN